MDCGNKKARPPSTRPLLRQQYQEQSSLCDVTIKVGLWEKRFHWCVLVTSPFFENIYRNKFLETQTGVIELNKWTSTAVEMAMMFLYGKRPNITQNNVDALLDMAEFMLIPQLKVACIDFLKKVTVTIDNCIQLFHLSSLYEFDLEKCDTFLKGKLPEVLGLEGMLTVTTDSLKLLLADSTLRYVSTECWFNFLVRWVNKVPQRKAMFVELFNMLDFAECNSDFLKNVVGQEPLVNEVREEMAAALEKCCDDQPDTVLIFRLDDYDAYWLNMRTLLWYRMDLSPNLDAEEIGHFRNNSVDGVRNKNSSCIYKVNRTYNALSILSHDLSQSDSPSKVSKVFMSIPNGEDRAATRSDFHHQSLSNDTLVAVSNKIVRVGGDIGARASANDLVIEKYFLQQAVLRGAATLNDLLLLRTIQERESGGRVKDCKTSTLYLGKLSEPETYMHAVLALKGHSISKLCIGDGHTIAMLSEDKDSLFIYQEPTSDLQCIRLKTDFRISISYTHCLIAIEDGFVLQYENHIVYILKLSGAALKVKYYVKQIHLQNVDKNYKLEVTHLFDGDTCFRHTRNRYCSDESTLEYVRHNDLVVADDIDLLHWNKIPLPSALQTTYRLRNEVFAIRLPKGTTRCHLDCPHCKMPKDSDRQLPQTTRNYDYAEDIDEYYYESSDSGGDGYYMESYMDHYDYYYDYSD